MTDSLPAGDALSYRENTTDFGTIRDVFQGHTYDLGRLRRNADLTTYRQTKAQRGMRPLILDAGANIGAASVYFHRQFPDASIVAVEPEPQNYAVLRVNAVGLPITCLHKALTSGSGAVRVTDPGLGSNAFRTEVLADQQHRSATTIEGISISEIFANRPRDTYPFIVKLDIEGAEGEVFSTNVEWLHHTPIVIIELHDWLLPRGRTSQNFLRAISGLDRDFVYIGESIFSIDNQLDQYS
jgi:FkbM family methyltransferase